MCYREIWLRIKELEGAGWQRCHVNEMSMVIWEGGHEQRIEGGKAVNAMDVWKNPLQAKAQWWERAVVSYKMQWCVVSVHYSRLQDAQMNAET